MVPYLAILLAGAIVGLVNGVVGGGSILSYPVLLAFGSSPVTAAIPNSLGVSSANIFALWANLRQAKVDLSKYEKLDTNWRDLGVAAPARRGLVDNNIFKLTDLKKVTKEDFMNIHAMGPAAAKLITHEMRKKGIKFKSS